MHFIPVVFSWNRIAVWLECFGKVMIDDELKGEDSWCGVMVCVWGGACGLRCFPEIHAAEMKHVSHSQLRNNMLVFPNVCLCSSVSITVDHLLCVRLTVPIGEQQLLPTSSRLQEPPASH